MTSTLDRFGSSPKRTIWRSILRRLPIKQSPNAVYLRKHETVSGVRRKISPAVFAGFHTFAVVRNPYDHAVSHYEFMKQFRIPSVAAKVAAMSFADYLRYRMKRPFWNDTFFARLPNQSHFVVDESGQLLVQRILRYETLDVDFGRLATELGFGEVQLPRINETLNRTKRRPWQSYYDAEVKELAEQLYATDFDLFRYPRVIA